MIYDRGMGDSEELWDLISGIEEQLPLQRDTLEAFFGTSFKGSVDWNGRPILVATTKRYEVELLAAQGDHPGNMTVKFEPPLRVASSAVYQRFPGGHSLPPPQYGANDLEGAYVANFSWGQIWFTFYTGNRLTQISIGPGMRGSPGV